MKKFAMDRGAQLTACPKSFVMQHICHLAPALSFVVAIGHRPVQKQPEVVAFSCHELCDFT